MESSGPVKYTNAAEAFAQLKIQASDEAMKTMELVGQLPESIKKHQVASDLMLHMMTIEEMRVLISGLQFSYADLRAEFVKAMPDFDAELNADTKTMALDLL
ncbi:hypothetical protein EVAR_70215_1 [Eumeta japonica]|uniref:Uncharacterized protein n=1 Tax=Eumeta variegata TaxID=151549 RepID=A0A4C1TAP3_EUMVA|nr:hypothetical protein EVAR_70213_1 [Eumeta japonica]GBP10552.1 hypothetical protein EVAR_70215_1 [Eumeta japonica]